MCPGRKAPLNYGLVVSSPGEAGAIEIKYGNFHAAI